MTNIWQWAASSFKSFGRKAAALVLLGIAIACSSSDSPERLSKSTQRVVLGVSIALPPAVSVQTIAVGANGRLLLADRARVSSRSALPAVSNAGGVETNVGVEARTGDLYSVASVTLRDRARVEGTLRTGGVLTRSNDTTVTGGVVERAVLSPPGIVSWNVDFPSTHQGPVPVPPDQTRTLAPGSYGALEVFSRATLRLSAGTYFFTTVAIEPQARLSLTTANGPVVIYVRTGFNFKGAVVDPQATARLLVVYLGTAATVVDAPFTGTLVAPSAPVTLASATHTGAFFARDLELRPDARIVHRPFPALPPGPCTGVSDGKSCNDGNACTQTDVCRAGSCVGASPLACAQPSNSCTEAFCDPGTGKCLTTPVEGRACNDNVPSTQGDICVLGRCNPSEEGDVPGTSTERCASERVYENLLRTDSAFRQRRNDIERGMAMWEQNVRRLNPESVMRASVYVIPVVVHVVYNTPAQRISAAEIQSQIDVLNEDYRRLNADAGSVRAEFAAIAADTRIEFRLARRDPNCQPTNGITETATAQTIFPSTTTDIPGIKAAATGGADPWPTDQYLNMWVGPTDLLGLGTPPGWPSVADGVVIDSTAFGRLGTASPPYDRGRTATHEIGHYLNIWHSFQDGCTGTSPETCTAEGDLVCDTPGDPSEDFTCPGVENGCTDTPVDSNDLTENYMEYVDDVCMFMFSTGQASRMIAALNGPRASLLASAGHIAPPAVASDIWLQDTVEDVGVEPNTLSPAAYISDDIWVRRNADGLTNAEHENPVFRPSGPPNKVYVRVRNLGCQASENANVQGYWAKASTSLSWPAPWDGSVTAPLMGSPLGSQPTGSLPPGGSAILQFDWSPPNPADYASFGADESHFCLLSRIETAAGMTFPETTDLVANVLNNNNIAWKNVTVVGDGAGRVGAVSMNGTPAPTRLEFVEPDSPRNRVSVFSWGSVLVDLGPTLFQRWTEGGSLGSDVQAVGGTTVRLLRDGASLRGIPLAPSDRVTIRVQFVSDSSSYDPPRALPDVYLLDVRQLVEETTGLRLLGGQRFALKTTRPFFEPSTEPG